MEAMNLLVRQRSLREELQASQCKLPAPCCRTMQRLFQGSHQFFLGAQPECDYAAPYRHTYIPDRQMILMPELRASWHNNSGMNAPGIKPERKHQCSAALRWLLLLDFSSLLYKIFQHP